MSKYPRSSLRATVVLTKYSNHFTIDSSLHLKVCNSLKCNDSSGNSPVMKSYCFESVGKYPARWEEASTDFEKRNSTTRGESIQNDFTTFHEFPKFQ